MPVAGALCSASIGWTTRKAFHDGWRRLNRLLERDAALRDGIRYIQIAVPSREEVETCIRQFRREVEERVGHINGAYGTAPFVTRALCPWIGVAA